VGSYSIENDLNLFGELYVFYRKRKTIFSETGEIATYGSCHRTSFFGCIPFRYEARQRRTYSNIGAVVVAFEKNGIPVVMASYSFREICTLAAAISVALSRLLRTLVPTKFTAARNGMVCP
jgi:hypothetical protein